MSDLMPSEILDDVMTVLRNAGTGSKGTTPRFLTAYQILERLPQPIRDRLIRERGMPGTGSGNNYAAASVVSDACEMWQRRGKVRIEYLDPKGMQVQINAVWRTPSDSACGLYQIIESDPVA